MLETVLTVLRAFVAILVVSPGSGPVRAIEHAVCVVRHAEVHHVPWERLVAVVKHESDWIPDRIGRTNDWGLGQIHCPSPFCSRVPTDEERSLLLDGCVNLGYAATILEGGLGRYNPGNPEYAARVSSIESRVRRIFR